MIISIYRLVHLSLNPRTARVPRPLPYMDSWFQASPEQTSHVAYDKRTFATRWVFYNLCFLPTTRFLMDDVSIPDPNLAKTQKALQEIRDLPPQDHFWPCNSNWPCSACNQLACNFLGAIQRRWKKYWLRACLLVWTVTYSKLVPREFQLEATIASIFPSLVHSKK